MDVWNVKENAPPDAPWHERMLMNHEEMYVMYTASEQNNQTCRFSLMDQMIYPHNTHTHKKRFTFHLWFSLAVWKTLGTNQAATTSISSSIPNWVPFGRPMKPLRETKYTTEPLSWLHHWSEVPYLVILSKASSVQALVTAMIHLHNTVHHHALQ